MIETRAYGAISADRPLQPMSIDRRLVGPHDVLHISFCGEDAKRLGADEVVVSKKPYGDG
jgi:hypothetical protein